jgi:hypothetical protein
MILHVIHSVLNWNGKKEKKYRYLVMAVKILPLHRAYTSYKLSPLLRGSNAHHATGNALARVSCAQGVLVSAAAQVILVRLHYQASAYDGVGANKLHQSVLNVHVRNARLVSLNVAWESYAQKL